MNTKRLLSVMMVSTMCLPALAEDSPKNEQRRSTVGEISRQEHGSTMADQRVTGDSRAEKDHDHSHTTSSDVSAMAAPADSQATTQMHLKQDLVLMNQKEVALSQFAAQRAQSDEVKQFAQMMVDEHTQLLQQMGASPRRASAAMGDTARDAAEGAAEEGNLAVSRATGEADTDMAQQGLEVREGASSDVYAMAGGASKGAGDELSRVHQQVAERRMASTREYLSEKEGTEFDKAYMGMQIMEHQEMLDKIEVYQQYMPEQREVLQQARKHTQDHLQQARQIMQQLDRG